MAKRSHLCDAFAVRPMGEDSSLPLVCIIDDDETDRLLAERAMRRIGIKNPRRSFASGGEFMAFVESTFAEAGEENRLGICVVFVDLRMPPPDGFEVLGWIRRQPSLGHVQVVVLTGSVDPKDMRRAAELRADLYLPKFPSDETLARVVSKASDGARQALRFANSR